MTDPTHIQALRSEGLSFSEIGARFGISKDAARGLLSRHVARGAASVSVPSVRKDRAPRAEGPVSGVAVVPPVEPGPSGPRYVGFSIGYFDLEASGLTGSFGRLFSAACAHAEAGDEWVARIDDPKYRNRKYQSDDKALAIAIRDHLESHDILVSWNGKRNYHGKGRAGYDVPMLNTRLVNPEGGSQRMLSRFVKHIDLLPEARKYMQLHSFRLAAVEEFLELAEQKNSILPRLWNKALDGDRDSLDYIVEHNLKDVRVLRLVFEEFRKAGLLEKPSW